MHPSAINPWVQVLRYWPLFVSGLRITVEVSIVSFAVSLALGIIGAAARRSSLVLLRVIAGAYVEIFRNTPLLLQIFVAFFGLPSIGLPLSGFEAGALALSLNAGAYITEMVRGGIDSISNGQYDAAKMLSLSQLDIFAKIVLPQALRNVYPPIINQFIQIVLGSSLLSAIAVQEVTGIAETVNSETLRTLQVFAVALVIYLIVSNLISLAAEGFAAAAFHPPLEVPARTLRRRWRWAARNRQMKGSDKDHSASAPFRGGSS